MARKPAIDIESFERAVDQFFNELLIDRWHCQTLSSAGSRAEVTEWPDHYEVRIALPGTDPGELEVEVKGRRLSVRAPEGLRGIIESSFSFSQPIEPEGVTARWSDELLTVSVPKKRSRRIAPVES